MTDRLYYSDSYMQAFEGVVREAWESQGLGTVILDRSAFYPASGGQPCDTGRLGDVEIVEVQDDENRILHFIRGSLPDVGSRIRGTIDWERRFDHMQQHTGQHVLSQAFERVHGAATVSFHMSRETSTLDLAAEKLGAAELEQAEDLANRIVWEDRPVIVDWVEPSQAQELPLRKIPERSGRLRVVEVQGFDYSACGGTHCRRTGEVGLIRICGTERMRGQLRIEFVCGRRALRLMRRHGAAISELGSLYSTGVDLLADTVRRRIDEEKSLRRELGRLEDRILQLEADGLQSRSESMGGVEVCVAAFSGYGPQQLNRLATLALGGASGRILLLGSASDRCHLLFASAGVPGLSMGQLLRETVSALGGKGGGPADRGQGSIPDPACVGSALDHARGTLRVLALKKPQP